MSVPTLLPKLASMMPSGSGSSSIRAPQQQQQEPAMNATKNTGGLSRRGQSDARAMEGRGGMLKELLRNQYDKATNPDGIVLLSIADNSLCRKELVEFFTSPGRLVLEPRDLTYADGLFASYRVLNAICKLYNEVPDGFYSDSTWTPPITPLKTEHLIIGNGATEIIESVCWALCDPGEGILLSEPYYNAFDEDVTTRARARIVPVQSPVPPSSPPNAVREPVDCFGKDTVATYEDALAKAKKQGIAIRAVFVCNPHNPTGCIYPRETVVALAAFAAEHGLHLVMDEIYARSVFATRDVPNPTQFDSILRMDTEKEAGLHPSRVHVISSASKDYSINGFRIGIFISQHNQKMIDAMTSTARFSQTASPAGQLFATMLNDRKFLTWFLAENRRRLTKAYNYVTDFCKHHDIPYVPSNAGHFLLLDLQRFLGSGGEVADERVATTSVGDDDVEASAGAASSTAQPPGQKPLTPERSLTNRFIDGGVVVAPGAQYHHPTPGFFRLTFSIDSEVLQIGLTRMEKVLGLHPWIESQPLPEE